MVFRCLLLLGPHYLSRYVGLASVSLCKITDADHRTIRTQRLGATTTRNDVNDDFVVDQKCAYDWTGHEQRLCELDVHVFCVRVESVRVFDTFLVKGFFFVWTHNQSPNTWGGNAMWCAFCVCTRFVADLLHRPELTTRRTQNIYLERPFKWSKIDCCACYWIVSDCYRSICR